MATLDLTPGVVNVPFVVGDDAVVTLKFGYDWTGATHQVVIRAKKSRSSAVLLDLGNDDLTIELDTPSEGYTTVTFVVPSDLTSDFSIGEMWFDHKITDSLGRKRTWVTGKLYVDNTP